MRHTNHLILITLFYVQQSDVQQLLHGTYHPPPVYRICSSHVYCQGELLNAIQLSNVFPSSKDFVDMQLRYDEIYIRNKFDILQSKFNGNIPESELKEFVKTNFQPVTLDKWLPPDFNEFPLILNRVQDKKYKEFLSGVNQSWKSLARKVSEEIQKNKDRNSMIYVPNGFFVNIENQDEFFYWDTYWIIRGALICGMNETVKGILLNLIHLIKTFGYIVTANRIYYKGRTQLPLFTQMMSTYYTYTKDEKFILDNIEFIDEEMMFWLIHRNYQVKSIGNIYNMAHYMSDKFDPRPEMYKEDVTIALMLNNSTERHEFWCRTKASTESGWGFSSRHFHNRNNYDDVKKILLKTNPLNFVYVELNAVLQSNSNILSQMFLMKKDQANYIYYKEMAHRFQVGINALLWNDEERMWFDFDSTTGKSRNFFYASNLAPLWTGSYDEKLSKFYGDAAVDYLIRNNIINEDLTPRYVCIPTSFYNTDLEWDYYNCMPQLQSMVIIGLQTTASERAQQVALNFASSWAYTTYFEYNRSGTIRKMYKADRLGSDDTQKLPANASQPQACGVTMGSLFEIFEKWGNILRSY